MAKISDGSVIFHKSPSSFMGNRWFDASVTGSGNVTVAATGAFARESILINHVDLKCKGYTGVLQDVSDVFPKIRKLYNEAKIFDAEKLLSNELVKRGYKPEPEQYLPLIALNLNFVNESVITDYTRTTDMSSGEITVQYKTGGCNVRRGLFVHRGSDVIAYNAVKSGTHKFNVQMELGLVEQVANSTTKYEDGFMCFHARGSNGLDYGIVVRVVGATETNQNGISVKSSDGFTVFAKTFINSSHDTEFKKIKAELSSIKVSYDKLHAQSENAHRKVYDATSFKLNHTSNNFDIANLVGSTNLDSVLIERLFNFGKYLSVIGYTKLMQPDINVSSHLLFGGIVKSADPQRILELFEMYEKYVDDLKKNAARIYGMRGYFVPSVVSPESALLGSTDAGVIHFIASGALVCNLFYSYYLATGDIKTLKGRIFPFMREVFNFYSDFLKLDNNGLYTTMPSYSPTSTPGNIIQGKPLQNFKFATNSTIDFLAISNLLDNLCEAGEALALTQEIPMWQDMKTKIPKFVVGDSGAIKEYTNSAFIDSVNNCGCMHTYGLWPLKNFSFHSEVVEYRPAVGGAAPSVISLRDASTNAIYNRINYASGLQSAQTLAMYAVQLAHAGNADAVCNMLLRLVASSFTSGGLCLSNDWRGSGWTKYATPQLDVSGNLGFSTAIIECIVQSNAETLKILPCIFEGIEAGSIENIVTDFSARVSIDWDDKRGRAVVKIMPKKTCVISVIAPKKYKLKSKLNVEQLQLTADKIITIEFA